MLLDFLGMLYNPAAYWETDCNDVPFIEKFSGFCNVNNDTIITLITLRDKSDLINIFIGFFPWHHDI